MFMDYIININKNIWNSLLIFVPILKKHLIMKTKENLMVETETQKIELVKGSFTKSEAAHLVNTFINEKINFYKIQRLKMWEGNHSCNTEKFDNRIEELEQSRLSIKSWLADQKSNGCNIKIDGQLKLTIED
jgi:hypothetical protein